jgi:hypothetical protein
MPGKKNMTAKATASIVVAAPDEAACGTSIGAGSVLALARESAPALVPGFGAVVAPSPHAQHISMAAKSESS